MIFNRKVYQDFEFSENHGDIPGYVKAELGLTDADLAKLRSLYTE